MCHQGLQGASVVYLFLQGETASGSLAAAFGGLTTEVQLKGYLRCICLAEGETNQRRVVPLANVLPCSDLAGKTRVLHSRLASYAV